MLDKAAKKDIFSIIIRLTITCLVAGIIMGAAFLLTHDAKQRNEIARDQRVMLSLLGYNKKTPAPDTMNLYPMHRYILDDSQNITMGYVIPSADDSHSTLVTLGLDGNYIQQYNIQPAC